MSSRRRRRNRLPDPEESNIIAAQRLTIEQHSGPLPSPDVLARFDAIVPGGAERIFVVFEKQAEHRMALESAVINGDQVRATAGLAGGLVIVIAFLAAAVYLGTIGQAWLAGVLGSVDLATLVSVFVYADRRRRQELDAKAQAVRGRG